MALVLSRTLAVRCRTELDDPCWQLRHGQIGVRSCAKITSGENTQFKHFERKRNCQKNGGRKMKIARFAPNGGAGCLIFLPRIFLTSSSRKARNNFCANP